MISASLPLPLTAAAVDRLVAERGDPLLAADPARALRETLADGRGRDTGAHYERAFLAIRLLQERGREAEALALAPSLTAYARAAAKHPAGPDGNLPPAIRYSLTPAAARDWMGDATAAEAWHWLDVTNPFRGFGSCSGYENDVRFAAVARLVELGQTRALTARPEHKAFLDGWRTCVLLHGPRRGKVALPDPPADPAARFPGHRFTIRPDGAFWSVAIEPPTAELEQPEALDDAMLACGLMASAEWLYTARKTGNPKAAVAAVLHGLGMHPV